MKHFISLIRFKNIAFVGLTMYLVRYAVLNAVIEYSPYKPLLKIDLSFKLSDFHFFLLAMATMLITAAGYAINDYFDRQTDLINRPDRVVVSTHLSRRFAIILNWVFSGAGIALGYWVSLSIGKMSFGMIFIFSAGALWFYSSNLSGKLLLGNLLVATLVGVVPLLVFLFDVVPMIEFYGNSMNKLFVNEMLFWVLGFSYFAFITNFIREIIKDMEDLEGDNAYGRNTLPIVMGMKNAKYIVLGLVGLLIGSLLFVVAAYLKSSVDWIYFSVAIILPALYLAFTVFKADAKKDYTRSSAIVKLIMFTGVMYSLVHYLQITQ